MTSGRWLRRASVAPLALAVLLALPLAPSAAQDQDAPVILIIDMQEILRQSLAVRAMQQSLDQRRDSYQGELQQREDEIRKEDLELNRQRSVLAADVYAKRRQDLEQEVASVQREIQEQKRALDSIFSQGMSQVRLALVEIVKGIAQERKADLVLSKANVVLVRPDLEITDEALQQLNEELPSIDIALPPQGAAGQ